MSELKLKGEEDLSVSSSLSEDKIVNCVCRFAVDSINQKVCSGFDPNQLVFALNRRSLSLFKGRPNLCTDPAQPPEKGCFRIFDFVILERSNEISVQSTPALRLWKKSFQLTRLARP